MLLQQRRKIVAPFAILGTIATYCIKSTFSNYTPATAFVVPFSLRRFYLSSSSSSSSSSSHVSSIRSIIVPRNVLFMSSTNDDIAASPNGEEEHSQFDWINDKEQWKTKKTPKDFSILSWNILSQNASTVIKNETYSYKGIDIPPPKPWEYRMPQITQKIHDINADLCCLQEMDITSFESMEPIMKKMGYEGVLQKKESSHPAVATFWKRGRFQIFQSLKVRSPTLSVLLQDILSPNSSLVLAVTNVHLEGHPHKIAQRVQQLHHALGDTKHVTHHAALVCGDFNCQVYSSACSSYLRCGSVQPPAAADDDDDDDNVLLEWNQPIPPTVYAIPKHAYNNTLKSAYPPSLLAKSPQDYFTYIRLPQRFAAGLDHLWYTSTSLNCVALKQIFSSEQERLCMLQNGLPSDHFPSDHLPIGAIFSWKKEDTTLPDLRYVASPKANLDKNKSASELLEEAEELKENLGQKQQLELEYLLSPIPNFVPGQKPTEEQKIALKHQKRRREVLIKDASKDDCVVIERIFKLYREASKK